MHNVSVMSCVSEQSIAGCADAVLLSYVMCHVGLNCVLLAVQMLSLCHVVCLSCALLAG